MLKSRCAALISVVLFCLSFTAAQTKPRARDLGVFLFTSHC